MEYLYFNEKLLEKLEIIKKSPISILEAPAGYGKTVAVHYILREFEGEDRVYWYTAAESMPDTSFRWFTNRIRMKDQGTARRLQDLGILNRRNAVLAAEILEELEIKEPMILVFDNFQFCLENWPIQIFHGLVKRRKDGLRTIFISQNWGGLREFLTDMEESICYVHSREFLLSENDIQQYAAQLSLSVTKDDLHRVWMKTDGWVAAVAMYLENYRDQVIQKDTQDLSDLLYARFWERLLPEQRIFLLRISLFDHISWSMIPDLIPESLLSETERVNLLHRTPLIRYKEIRNEYYLHEILQGFLKEELANTDEDFRNDVYRRSGLVYRKNDMIRDAVNCFYKAGDYEDLLSCRLVCLITETFDQMTYTEIAGNVLNGCPAEIQEKYPISLLRLCYALYAGCSFTEFEVQMRRIRKLFIEMGDSQLLGEWHLMNAFSFFPDLKKMKEQYEMAEELMEETSKVFIREEPFMFGCASMWYLFYSEPGTMMETADLFEDVMNLYNRLTGGHGTGAAEIYRGEALSVQGRFEESDIQAYQAAFLSEQYGNASATYGAALLLGINAIYRSDMEGLQKAVDYLENKARGYSFLQGKMLNTYMVETVRGYLLGLMMETGRSALWTQGEEDSLSDLTFTNFMIKTCRITDLLLKKEYKRAIASVETSLKLDPRLISTPTRNFMYCGLALCYLAIGRIIKASEYLDKSLTLAGQDKNYTFLACFRKYFQVIFLMPQIAVKHSKTIKEIKALDIRYTRADESRIFAMLEEVPEWKDHLTRKEREVAELAAQGLRNSEIAAQLKISENTVKHHLKIVFQKMNIDRRSKLIEMLR